VNSQDVRREWAERSGEYSPAYYAYYGPNGTSEAVRELLERHLDRDAAVLEVGCSSGRHLAHLHDAGFSDLHGVDINGEALEVMADSYPDLADAGTFHVDAVERVVRTFDDGEFDAVYSVETLQHIHPDGTRTFDELARVTDDLLVTAEIETGVDDGGDANDATEATDAPEVNYVDSELPLYYRNWRGVFAERGLVEVEHRECGRDTLRAFRRPDE
jgi:SAM-dependent methyltransferase